MSEKLSTAVILLAGGIGSRMHSEVPKQFLLLRQQPIIMYSFNVFIQMTHVTEIVVVCALAYRYLFKLPEKSAAKLSFAVPGARRQDSVYHGFQAITTNPDIVCVHDGARPFVSSEMTMRVIHAAEQFGAATTGMPIKFTLKECDTNHRVKQTLDRSKIWEIQTPQAIRFELLKKGFEYAASNHLTVTDDVSLVEQLGLPVHLVEGSYSNLKITTPEDLHCTEAFINS